MADPTVHRSPGLASLAELLDLDRLAALGVDVDAEALTDGTASLTWRGYHGAAGRVAAALWSVGVGAGDRVAVRHPKTAWSFVVVHGIVRAGAVVVPIDPLAAPDHAISVITDAEVSAIVTDHRLRAAREVVAAIGVPIVVAEASSSWGDQLAADGATVAVVPDEHDLGVDVPTPPALGPDDAAYLIYTSGSTGVPKGIVHTHASALAYASAAAAHYGVGPADRAANVAGLHFDQSTFELYAAPLAGAAVVVVPDVVLRFPASTADLLHRERTTIWYTVPHVLRQLVERGGLDERDWSVVRLVKYGGESYPPALLAQLMAHLPEAAVSNVYGPAEVNQCTAYELPDVPPEGEPVPLGDAWSAARLMLVDPDDRSVTIDVGVGELLVASSTMMRGYWNRPDLTDERIIERDGVRWYVTGDLVERAVDGALRFMGRTDNQVKVRGQRVELEAVDAAVVAAVTAGEAGVSDGVAVVDRSGPSGDVVVAIVEGVPGGEPPEGFERRLVAELAGALPAAAVPGRVMVVVALPRTSSGKVDRGAAQRLLEGVAS